MRGQVVSARLIVRRLVDSMAGLGILQQFLDLVRHIGQQPGHPIDLPGLLEDHGVEFVDGVNGVGKVDFELFQPGFVIVCHGTSQNLFRIC